MISKSDFIKRLSVLAKTIYDTPGGGAGCCLHIVLDDGNFEKDSVQFCLDHVNPKHGICKEVAEMMLQLTEHGRETAVGLGMINFEAVLASDIELKKDIEL